MQQSFQECQAEQDQDMAKCVSLKIGAVATVWSDTAVNQQSVLAPNSAIIHTSSQLPDGTALDWFVLPKAGEAFPQPVLSSFGWDYD